MTEEEGELIDHSVAVCKPLGCAVEYRLSVLGCTQRRRHLSWVTLGWRHNRTPWTLASGKRLTVDCHSACYVIVPSAVYLRVKILTDAGERGEGTLTIFTRNCQIIVKAVRRISWLSGWKRFTWRAHRSIHRFGGRSGATLHG